MSLRRSEHSGGEPGRMRRRIKPWRERDRRERGIAMVWMALTLLTMVLFAGFAVDVSNWYLRAERIQRAADAGALAGVSYLPGDLGTATTLAKDVSKRNGYAEGGSQNTAIAVTQEANPNRLRVKITTDVPTFFLGLIGMDKLRMTRGAVAEYVAPVPMGSPENKLGNDPARSQNTPQFWINVAGPNSTKESGDRYQAKNCSTSYANCTGTGNPGINNDDYSFDGYFFSLKVKSVVAGQPLNVQVYDPAFTYVGDTCGSNMPTQAQANALQALPGNPYPDAASRYAPGLTTWCTGDQDIGGRTTRTTFIVRAPDTTPWNNLDNPIVSGCTVTMPYFTPGENGFGTINEMLTPTNAKYNAQFASLFRQNVTVCSIPAASVKTGDYILQVRSNVTSAAPTTYSSSVTDGGHNRMSIFTGFGTAGLAAVDGTNVTINALGRLPIYANADAANTTFYLARVLPYDAGRTLRITLWDMGDASQAGTLQILPPAEYATTFAGCKFAKTGTGTMTTSASTCTISNVSSSTGFNGQLVTIDIPIPSDYDCDDDVGTGCWIKVRAAFPAGVSDTTTWSAAILGNPIRIVE
ncbi:TadE/TadG family type IV pilus assembly protein [Dermatobacter hominis]|uniref:TadE/TadG family type IV pilus assembly protein n=1 Tax=Dermatobacter hominis TaxID=2884263 RepID=UPI001D1020DE|nr:TadE/TadG family type IV pilus assembly protein [Dermatobacter hominis]UDY36491.1 pilus assembly protein TadG-related protein [Dermatobacter hominis]